MERADGFNKHDLHLKDAKAVHLCFKVGGFKELWEDLLTSYGFNCLEFGNSPEDVLSKRFRVKGKEVGFIADNIREHIVNSLPCSLDIFWLDWIINYHIRCWKDE